MKEQDIKQRQVQILQKIATRENFLPFLRLMANNPGMSLKNLMFLFDQKPDAGIVCGKRCWSVLGRNLIADAMPIQVLIPELHNDADVVRMRTVLVYGKDSTQGKVLEARKCPLFADRIAEVTGMTFEMVPESAFDRGMELGRFDKEQGVFYLSKECPAKLQEQILLELYVDYVMQDRDLDDPLLKKAVLYVLYEYWGMEHTIVSALFGRVTRLGDEKVHRFLKSTMALVRMVIETFEGEILSFTGTVLLNSLLIGAEPEKIKEALTRFASLTNDPELEQEVVDLIALIDKGGARFLQRLWEKKKERMLFSYPPLHI